jgi:hypothetical protein
MDRITLSQTAGYREFRALQSSNAIFRTENRKSLFQTHLRCANTLQQLHLASQIAVYTDSKSGGSPKLAMWNVGKRWVKSTVDGNSTLVVER